MHKQSRHTETPQRLLLIIILLLVVSLCLSCAGTTHHFLPPRPLEKNEVMLTWTWNYDFDQWNLPTFSPGMNVYAGLGNEDNIGAGFQILGVTHLSYAKYYDESESDKRFFYLHINQPLGTFYNNPYFEVGGGLSTYKSGTYQTISAGLGYGHGMSYGLNSLTPRWLNNRENERDFTHIWRFIPNLRYTAIGRDISVSLSYYHGKSRLIYDNIANAITNRQDTILYVPAAEIDSIIIDSNGHYSYADATIVYLKNDSTIEFLSNFICGMGMIFSPAPLFLRSDPLIWSSNGYYTVKRFEGRRFIGNYTEIFDTVKAGGDLLITEYPYGALNKLDRSRSFLRDLSIGVAVGEIKKSR